MSSLWGVEVHHLYCLSLHPWLGPGDVRGGALGPAGRVRGLIGIFCRFVFVFGGCVGFVQSRRGWGDIYAIRALEGIYIFLLWVNARDVAYPFYVDV